MIGLQKKLNAWPEIAQVKHIDRAAALKEFQENSGFGDALKALKDNPLPHLLIVYPSLTHNEAEQINHLLADLKKLPEVNLGSAGHSVAAAPVCHYSYCSAGDFYYWCITGAGRITHYR